MQAGVPAPLRAFVSSPAGDMLATGAHVSTNRIVPQALFGQEAGAILLPPR